MTKMRQILRKQNEGLSAAVTARRASEDGLGNLCISRSVLSTTRYPEAVAEMLMSISPKPSRMLKASENLAEFLAELRAERTPICPLGSTLLR
jgi:hypothetical protein